MNESVTKSRKLSFLYIPLLFLITSVVLDQFMYLFMGIDFPSMYIFSFCIMLIIAALMCITQRKWLQVLISTVLISLQLFFCISNVIAFSNLGEIFSLESLKALLNAFLAAASGNYNMWMLVAMFGTLVVYIVSAVVICKKFKTPIVKRKIFYPLTSILVVAACLLTSVISYVNLDKYADLFVDNLRNEKFTYDTFSNRIKNLSTFGSYSYYFNNFLYVMNLKTSPNDALSDISNTVWESDDFEYDTINQLKEGDNFIMILMETFELAAINPITMPNVSEFLNISTSVDGYSSIERTCMSDYISQAGIHALDKEMWSNYVDVEIPFSLANIFKRSGYVTSAFHNYDKDSYNRGELFPKAFGFDNFYDYSGIAHRDSVVFSNNKDEDLFSTYLDKIAPADTNFYSYIISISSHGLSPIISVEKVYQEEFNFINQNIDELSVLYPWLASDSAMERQTIKNYLAGTMSFDKGFGKLLERLKSTTGKDGRLLIDSTGIIMFGDHYYYLSPNAVSGEEKSKDALNGNKSPFIIYNPYDKTGKVIERFASNMDIYKTACSLFGIVTDKQLTIGKSVLTTADSIGIGYLNGKIWGKDWCTTDFKTFEGIAPTGEELIRYKSKANQVFEAIVTCTVTYNKNAFDKLDKAYYFIPSKVS